MGDEWEHTQHRWMFQRHQQVRSSCPQSIHDGKSPPSITKPGWTEAGLLNAGSKSKFFNGNIFNQKLKRHFRGWLDPSPLNRDCEVGVTGAPQQRAPKTPCIVPGKISRFLTWLMFLLRHENESFIPRCSCAIQLFSSFNRQRVQAWPSASRKKICSKRRC